MEPDKIVAGSRHRKSVEHYKVEDIHITEKLMVEPVSTPSGSRRCLQFDAGA